MGQVLLRSRALLKRAGVLVVVALLALGGSALVFVPLFGVPGYELGEALALGIGLLGGGLGMAAAFQERRLIQGRDPRPAGALRKDSAFGSAGAALGAAAVLNLAVLVPPFLTALGYSLVSTRCDPLAQIAFFPLITLPSALLASSVGVLTGFAARRLRGALALYVVILLGTLAWTVWPIYAGPQVFAFNHLLGYFPGPLYDETLTLRPALLWFRGQTLLWAAAAWLFAAFCLDMREGRLRRPHLRPASALLLGLTVVGALAIEQRGPALGLRMTPSHLDQALGGLRETTHFRIVYFLGKPKEELDRLERDLEFRWEQLSKFLGDAPKEKLNVYVYRSAEEKQRLVGAGGTQFAKPWQLALHVNDARFPHPVLKHELLHVMAAPFGTGPFRTTARFGVWTQMAVIEGLAVAGDNRVDDLTLHQWAAAMRRNALAPDVRQLFSVDGFYRVAASRAYTTAGSFLRFLAETYGTERLRSLYLDGDFHRAYGKPLESLAAEWERWIDEVPLDARAEAQAYQRFRRPSLFARSCAREVAALEDEAYDFLRSDPEQALTRFERCADLQPEEPGYRLAQARTLTVLGRHGEADALLSGLQTNLADRPAVGADVAVARADAAWESGRVEVAREHLHRALTLEPPLQVDRAARVKLAALEDPIRGPAVRAWFSDRSEDVKLLIVLDALERSPNDPWLNYLLGRRLTHTAPNMAVPRLARALEGDLPDTLRREALRLKIEANYLAGDCAAVEHDVGALPDLGPAFALTAREWVDRCGFETRTWNGPLVPDASFR